MTKTAFLIVSLLLLSISNLNGQMRKHVSNPSDFQGNVIKPATSMLTISPDSTILKFSISDLRSNNFISPKKAIKNFAPVSEYPYYAQRQLSKNEFYLNNPERITFKDFAISSLTTIIFESIW